MQRLISAVKMYTVLVALVFIFPVKNSLKRLVYLQPIFMLIFLFFHAVFNITKELVKFK